MHLAPAFARAVRETPYDASVQPFVDILKKHDATLSCQFDEFARYVAAAEAHGDGDTTLAKWTRAVLAMPSKRDYFKTIFVAAVKGEQLFDEATADALMADFAPLKDTGLITKLSRISNDPAKNPQAPAKFRR
jgi:hypothetical protein